MEAIFEIDKKKRRIFERFSGKINIKKYCELKREQYQEVGSDKRWLFISEIGNASIQMTLSEIIRFTSLLKIKVKDPNIERIVVIVTTQKQCALTLPFKVYLKGFVPIEIFTSRTEAYQFLGLKF